MLKLRNVALASAVTMAAPTAATSAEATRIQGKLPENIASFAGQNKALLAYKAVGDGKGGKTVALILRDPKDPDPGLEKSAEDRIAYTCELVLLDVDGDKIRVTGKSKDAVDCDNNEINRKAGHLELSDHLNLSVDRVTFMNENIRGGSYTYAFALAGGMWHLAEATDFYKTFEKGVDEVLIAREFAAYPKDFGLIPMEKFTPSDIRGVLYKNRSL